MTEPALDVHLTPEYAAQALRADVRAGLTAYPKWLSLKWFYDTVGSALFEDITRLPEYYPTRAEREVLAERAQEIARTTGAYALVELGSGSSQKTRLLLSALSQHGSLREFVPQDVSVSALTESARAILADYPGLIVRGVVGDFTQHLRLLPGESPRVVAFLGGTIGNLLPDERGKFFRMVRDVLQPGEWLLLGTDLVKDPETLVRAYDDSQGVNAEFNRNALSVINREVGGDFDLEAFEYVALWNAEQEQIELGLRAKRDMRVTLTELGRTVEFREGEELRTAVSAKFREDVVRKELEDGGFELHRWWTDSEERFAVSLARAI
ncbi:L-histidine N(alpha)-methyltransferase [Lentzea sp. NPDC004782]|uniref:L-histidine N(alpha)-methyltransferase n=1 Tax=Lentzea sp. NPDC004782 TaxID=3154458 RepID=UPI0033B9C8D7